MLSLDQRSVVERIAASGRTVDVLVGPAGAGKTLALGVLRRTWEAEHGAGSVIGLAPSAAAAEVLAGDLGIVTENTAKWLFEHVRGRWDLRAGELVIADEASLAGTMLLDQLTTHAATVGAKVPLAGDPAQLAHTSADELCQQRGELLGFLLVQGVAGAWDHLDLAAPERGNVQLPQVAKADQLVVCALHDGPSGPIVRGHCASAGTRRMARPWTAVAPAS